MPREFHFPVAVAWEGGRRTTATVEGKPPVAIATPPEFRGTDPDAWSPEDFLTAAAGSCLAVSIVSIAEHRGVPLRALDVSADGVVGRPEGGGHMRFLRIAQRVRLATDEGFEEQARAVVEAAESSCLVAVSLAVPVETEIEILTPVTT
jgi:organic hydroperoxide reductase OsmC/OhrA